MISKLRFYVRHSFNDLRVNRQRTIFALLCIAAGVAAIVSLQTLGVMIQDSLTGSVQESNGGDIQLRVATDRDVSTSILDAAREQGLIEKPEPSGLFSSRETNEQAAFFYTAAGVETIRDWFDTNYPGTEITYREVIPGGHGPMSTVSINDLRTNQEQMFVAPIIVDAQVYPLYGERVSEDDQPLSELLREPSDIVISRTLADTLDAQIGDTVRLSGSNLDFTLRGILPDDAEGGIENIGGALFGYFMVDLSTAPTFENPAAGIDSIFIKLPNQVQVEQVAKSLNTQYPFVSTTTIADLEEQNTEISDTLNNLVTVMGLVSLLIGGIGIINTMQVV
ncbi:MAG TPA: ABC transporter permease, partial [Aggregatilineaceae bacterium]|nr:ABC transporter permease [Aggregatilineaceae bacterium]